MSLDFVSQGVWDDMKELSNDMIGYDSETGLATAGTLTLYPFSGTATNRSGAGVGQEFGQPIPGIPCRVDVDVKGLIPQRMKDNIEAQKVIRYLFIPLDYLTRNNLFFKVKDEIETTEGHPLGVAVRYRVLDADTETDQLDVTVLVEEVV